jgi:hypothetical protein
MTDPRVKLTADGKQFIDIITHHRTYNDWKCPKCKCQLAKIIDGGCVCINGHFSE